MRVLLADESLSARQIRKNSVKSVVNLGKMNSGLIQVSPNSTKVSHQFDQNNAVKPNLRHRTTR